MRKNDYTIGEAMQEMLKAYRLKPQFDENRLKYMWEELMGKMIATYTTEIHVKRGVLYLTIISAPLKQELSFGKDKIRKIVNEAMGSEYVTEVVIR